MGRLFAVNAGRSQYLSPFSVQSQNAPLQNLQSFVHSHLLESNQKKRKKIKLFDPVCFGSAQEQEMMVYKNLSKNNKKRGEELFKSKKKKKKKNQVTWNAS